MITREAARTLVKSAYLKVSVPLLEERCEPAECVPHKMDTWIKRLLVRH